MAGRLGVWIIGVRGGVSVTTLVGLAALRRGLTQPIALTTALPMFDGIDLVGWDDVVCGGHDIRNETLFDEAMKLANVSRAIDPRLVDQIRPELDAIDQDVRSGSLHKVGPTITKFADDSTRSRRETPRKAIARIQHDIREFRTRRKLDRVLVLNLASTEPPVDDSTLPSDWVTLEATLDDVDACPLAASSLYAVAALDMGAPYVNFTPSLGSAPAAIQELAIARGACHMGHDGKTGETLLKSALAPMFAARNLNVMSWVGHNIFGNMDGKVLDDPANKKTKVRSKDRLLHKILGYSPQTLVSIEYIESLGDWKTAWDHIHFQGFLGTPMTMQFTWQGCDSLLAAPLAIDLIRLVDHAQRHGEKGLLPWLACFFKSPLGTDEHNFVKQFQALEAWAATRRR